MSKGESLSRGSYEEREMSTPPTPSEEKTTLTIGQLLGHSNQFQIVRAQPRSKSWSIKSFRAWKART